MTVSNGRDAREVVTQQTYDVVAAKYTQTRCGKGSWRAELELLWQALPGNQKSLKVLDLGCGSGRILQAMIDQEVGLTEYVGVDYSEEMLAEAIRWHILQDYPLHMEKLESLLTLESKARQFAQHVKQFFVRPPKLAAYFCQGNMQEIDPPTSYFDAVTLAASFHHLYSREDQETLLELCFHTLKPGGILWMMNWNLLEDTAPKNATRTEDPDVWEVTFSVKESLEPQKRYYKTTSSEEMRQLLLYAGFEITEERDLGNNLVWVAKKPVID